MKEQIRLIFVSTISLFGGVFSDTREFLIALILAFFFNILTGMKADGISIVRCKNFSFSKFITALRELVLYVILLYVVKQIMFGLGDKNTGLIVMKTITYVFCYVYIQNGLKNTILSYPKSKLWRILYHIIRLEFTRALPVNVRSVIERVERNEDDKKQYKKSNS